MQTVLTFVIRVILLAAGLVFAASLALAFVLMLTIWGVRAVWARLTGRPVTPFVMRIHPRDGFERMYRRSGAGSRTPRADALRPTGRSRDVTDVELKQ